MIMVKDWRDWRGGRNNLCRCENPKHFKGCSIPSSEELCIWCETGCKRRKGQLVLDHD